MTNRVQFVHLTGTGATRWVCIRSTREKERKMVVQDVGLVYNLAQQRAKTKRRTLRHDDDVGPSGCFER